ncbi:hypothetical protein F4560_001050 [Saccharothrix ecbatanensis]|uniref:DUF397 domain-containing protein n=1 Tax=Saccharothrix ecbatanensis TaxID=1105145 RepID=A0A7W9LZ34_9PSEU|nr:DUF397 domain-containing protein [Saccharothrix ecbatanensis]MBB5801282.1 hypothetical protein [Saccharothrix ecbatanensis]
MTPADRLAWRTSTRSSNGENCVEVAPTADGAIIRHSKNPDHGTIAFSHPEWVAFVREARDDVMSANGVAAITRIGTDTLVKSLNTEVELRFDDGEWSAFRAGAAAGEFDFSSQLASA